MSTEAGRPRDPHVPLPPAAPPRPAAPPKPTSPPEPATKAGNSRGADPIPQDEPTTRVSPRPRRTSTASASKAPAGAASEPKKTAEAGKAGEVPRRPQPAPPPSSAPSPPPPPSPSSPRPSASGPAGPEATARLAAVRVPPKPLGKPVVPAAPPPAHRPAPAPPSDDDLSGPPTFRLRPIRVDEPRRIPARSLAAAACLVLGVGLLGGTTAGTLLSGDAEAGQTAAQAAFAEARGLWHSVPVNTLFPRTVVGQGAGPGGADRNWTRVAVAPDSTCRQAFDPLLAKALAPAGCHRLVRATYADETSTSVITVGILFTEAERSTMRALRKRFAAESLTERTDLMPRPYGPRGTVAADFGDGQRASWTLRVLGDAPVVVYAVSGFADGRTVAEPQPAEAATAPDATSPPAQAGLGHDAVGLAERVEKGLRVQLPDDVGGEG